MRFKWLASIIACGVLGGCATYHAAPLPTRPDLAAFPTKMNGEKLRKLSLAQAAALAVRKNPQLKANSLKIGISAAELYRAGLIPDPQFGYSVDHPSPPGPGLVNAYNAGLSQDLKWLFTRGATLDAARAARLQKTLQVAWQAWQLSQKTQQLYIRLWSERRRIALLERQHVLYLHRQHATQAALNAGDVTLDSAAADLVALTQVDATIAGLRRRADQTRISLDSLMGLRPDAPWIIERPTLPKVPSAAHINSALAQLPRKRPDLLALQAGYASSDARYRAAILGQFPALNVGITRASDTSGVTTTGIGITLSLPIFNGNRGQIAFTRATRAQLRAAYQARLDQASSEVQALIVRMHDVRAALTQLQARLPQLREVARRAANAFASGNLSGATYIVIQSNYLSRELEALSLRQSLMAGTVGLRTLLGEIPTGVRPTTRSQKH